MRSVTACLLIPALIGLSGCDSVKSEFNTQFDKQFREQCIKAATEKGAPQAIAQEACNCTMDKLKEGKSDTDFNVPSQEEQMAAAKTCMGELQGKLTK